MKDPIALGFALHEMLAVAITVLPEMIDMEKTTVRIRYADGTSKVKTTAEILQNAATVLGIKFETDET